jgi:hypothetical protein
MKSTDTLSSCVDSILLNGKGRVHCVNPGYLTSLIPEPLVFVLQGMNLTAKGFVFYLQKADQKTNIFNIQMSSVE